MEIVYVELCLNFTLVRWGGGEGGSKRVCCQISVKSFPWQAEVKLKAGGYLKLV